MRLPNRKPGKYTFPNFDPHMTRGTYDALREKLRHIKHVRLPAAIKETRHHGENGDFSENAEYQIAKGRLRGLLRAVDELSYQINHAEIIDAPQQTHTVNIGHTVTLLLLGANKHIAFKILGPTEADPAHNVISYKSPLGQALIGHAVGDTISLHLKDKTVEYTIEHID